MSFVPLGEIVEIKGGGTPDKAVADYWNGDIPWASVKDFKSTSLDRTTDFITPAGVKNSATNIIPAGTIIVPTRMAVGKAAISTIDLAINQDLKALFPKKAADTRYLLHALLASSDHLERNATGATVKGITLGVLRGLKIPLPPLPEQRRIAGILDQADALRRLRRQSLSRLSALGQAIFYEMFGDVSQYRKTTALSDLIHVRSGEGLTTKAQKGGSIPVYGGNGVTGWHDKYNVPADTIILGRVGAYCGAVHTTSQNSWVTDNALIIRKKIDLSTRYLADALKIANLNQYAGRSSQPLISGGRIYGVEILVPDPSDQIAYHDRLAMLDIHTAKVQRSIDENDTLFASLQHRAFRGEL